MLSLSRRARELGTENAFVVLGEVEKLSAQGKDIVSFCIGQPDFTTPDHIRMAGIQAITAGHTGYTPSPGIAPLRKAHRNSSKYCSCFDSSSTPASARATRL